MHDEYSWHPQARVGLYRDIDELGGKGEVGCTPLSEQRKSGSINAIYATCNQMEIGAPRVNGTGLNQSGERSSVKQHSNRMRDRKPDLITARSCAEVIHGTVDSQGNVVRTPLAPIPTFRASSWQPHKHAAASSVGTILVMIIHVRMLGEEKLDHPHPKGKG